MRNPGERLRDTLEAISSIERYLDQGKGAFEQDELLQGWFVRHLQIIGEAARALPEEVRILAPEIEWTKIIRMRNVLVHDYFEMDTDLVWDAATRDVPALRPAGEQLGRIVYACEIAPPYVGVCLERMVETLGLEPRLVD